MPRKTKIEAHRLKIAQEYQKTNASKQGYDYVSDIEGNTIGVNPSDYASPNEREQNPKRYDEGYIGGASEGSGGIEDGQGFDRELYRGDGQSGRPVQRRVGRPHKSNKTPDQLPAAEEPERTGQPTRLKALGTSISKMARAARESADQIQIKPFTTKEAEGYRDKMTLAYKQIFKELDKLIEVTNGSHQLPRPIWSMIDNSDIETLVEARLGHAQRSTAAAKYVVFVVSLWERLAEFIIIAPRIWMSLEVYHEFGIDIPLPRRATIAERRQQRRQQRYAREQGYRGSFIHQTVDSGQVHQNTQNGTWQGNPSGSSWLGQEQQNET